jgi:hypothetical protein
MNGGSSPASGQSLGGMLARMSSNHRGHDLAMTAFCWTSALAAFMRLFCFISPAADVGADRYLPHVIIQHTAGSQKRKEISVRSGSRSGYLDDAEMVLLLHLAHDLRLAPRVARQQGGDRVQLGRHVQRIPAPPCPPRYLCIDLVSRTGVT